MIGEVQKALTSYNDLDPQGKRLFRDELGLVRPQQARPRKRRASKPVDTEAVTPLRRTRRAVQQPTAETVQQAI